MPNQLHYIKKQSLTSLLQECAPAPLAAPTAPAPSAAQASHVQYGGVMLNVYPGATVGPITTIHHYPEPKKENHGN